MYESLRNPLKSQEYLKKSYILISPRNSRNMNPKESNEIRFP